jgi:hypothetical protein
VCDVDLAKATAYPDSSEESTQPQVVHAQMFAMPDCRTLTCR